MWEKEKMLVTSIFSFSRNIFRNKIHFFNHFILMFANPFILDQSKNLLFGKEVKRGINVMDISILQ